MLGATPALSPRAIPATSAARTKATIVVMFSLKGKLIVITPMGDLHGKGLELPLCDVCRLPT
ncbi:MAG: hypothetical protein KBE22_08135 [Candidatus Accumulibacter sp.]|uniref:Uncharacterized protein n=1 Tax=Candidatus Accumulibacter affinis TaxID=2954384 RepID=A0A935TAW1_9PROT|nr:hypothetical protein [Candidatus Accumulibacter affinis]MBP9804856.1 hypothetical protein [Accumulibacter sp.]